MIFSCFGIDVVEEGHSCVNIGFSSGECIEEVGVKITPKDMEVVSRIVYATIQNELQHSTYISLQELEVVCQCSCDLLQQY